MTNDLRCLSGNSAENVLIRDCQYVFFFILNVTDLQCSNTKVPSIPKQISNSRFLYCLESTFINFEFSKIDDIHKTITLNIH